MRKSLNICLYKRNKSKNNKRNIISYNKYYLHASTTANKMIAED